MNNDPINTLMKSAAEGNPDAKASLLSISSNVGFSDETRQRAQTAINMLDGKVEVDNAKTTDVTGDNIQPEKAGGKQKTLTGSISTGVPSSMPLMQQNTVHFVERPVSRSGFMDAWFLGLLTLIIEPLMMIAVYWLFK